MPPKGGSCCGFTLRPLCLIIGYLHLMSSVVDLVCHLLVVAVVTDGFQCDVNTDRLQFLYMPGVEPILMILNIGTHGFHPYPRFFSHQYHIYVEQMSMVSAPRCYPGMLHINLIDVINILVNLIWFKIVLSYVVAVHKRNTEPMRMFFSLSIVKLIMMVMYFGYLPFTYDVYSPETIWFMKLTDIFIAMVVLIVVHRYTKALKMEKAAGENMEKPPPYVECLINTPSAQPPTYEPKTEMFVIDEEKKPMDASATTEAVNNRC